MYALTRGLVSVFALGTAYWLGWAAAAVVTNRLTVGATVLIMAVSLLVLMNISAVLLRNVPDPLKKRRIEFGYAVVLLIAFVTIGYALGVRYTATARRGALLAFLAVWSIIACLRAYGAYKSFAGQFAGTVWRDYLAYNVAASMHPKPDSENE